MDQNVRIRINQVLIRLADGDRRVFDEAYQLMWPLVLKAATRLVGNSSEAEDVTQETLIKVFAQVNDFDRQKDGITWALAIAKFEFMTLRKSKMRQKEVHIEQTSCSFESNTRSAQETLENRQMNIALAKIISELNGEDQETIRIYLEEASEARSPKMRKRFQRAIAKIKDAWREAYGKF